VPVIVSILADLAAISIIKSLLCAGSTTAEHIIY